MKRGRKYVLLIILTILYNAFISNYAKAEDLKTVLNLTGYWKFKLGDNLSYAKADYNDNEWDKIYVPDNWEDRGYYGYDGYAWYRKTFDFPYGANYGNLYLFFSTIDDVDEVYLNGQLIGGTGSFPPEYISRWNESRKYYLPKEWLKEKGNVLAVRVYDSQGEGGIKSGSVKICFDEETEYLEVDLSGYWKFHLHDNKEWKNRDYNDSKWETIYAPMKWDNQGYFNFDGYAWYRKKFQVTASLLDKGDLYLILGKIDDTDKVYINGEYIGSVYDIMKEPFNVRNHGEWYARRIYEIPRGVLKQGENVIAIRVHDEQLQGGIYEGPLGILTKKNYERLTEKYRYEKSFWNIIFDI